MASTIRNVVVVEPFCLSRHRDGRDDDITGGPFRSDVTCEENYTYLVVTRYRRICDRLGSIP